MKHKPKGNLVVLIIILILVPVFILSGLQFLESTGLLNPAQDEALQTQIVNYNGKDYLHRRDLTVIMVAGIDEPGPAVSSEAYNNPGEADMVALLIFDDAREKMDILTLNRDTIMDIPVTGITGKPAGTVSGQLALAHTYGTGLKDSAENLKQAVSTFLEGQAIDYYITLRMDAIGHLNDAVGGVEVNITEDFSHLDPAMTGKVKLTAQQAQLYIQGRKGVEDELNLSRMQRQEKFMRGLVAALKAKAADAERFATELFANEELQQYMVTDCNEEIAAKLASRFGDYAMGDIFTFKGKNVAKDYMEFHVTEKDRKDLIFAHFYKLK